jgi:hypothetical protein
MACFLGLVILYVIQCWEVKNRHLSKHGAAKMRMLRYMSSYKGQDQITKAILESR